MNVIKNIVKSHPPNYTTISFSLFFFSFPFFKVFEGLLSALKAFLQHFLHIIAVVPMRYLVTFSLFYTAFCRKMKGGFQMRTYSSWKNTIKMEGVDKAESKTWHSELRPILIIILESVFNIFNTWKFLLFKCQKY